MRTKGKNVTTDALVVGDIIILGVKEKRWEVRSVTPARFMQEALRVHVREIGTGYGEIFFFDRKALMTLAPSVTTKEMAEAQPFAESAIKETDRFSGRTEYNLGMHNASVQLDSDGRWVSFLDGEPLADHLDRAPAEDLAKEALRYHRTIYLEKPKAPKIPASVQLDKLNKILGETFALLEAAEGDLTQREQGARTLARRIVRELGITALEGK
jgi:hypothetical protein